MFNKKQKDSLAKLCYDLIKLIVGGMAIVGVMQKEIPDEKIRLAFVLCVVFLAGALIFEDEKEEDQNDEKMKRKDGG